MTTMSVMHDKLVHIQVKVCIHCSCVTYLDYTVQTFMQTLFAFPFAHVWTVSSKTAKQR